MRGLTLDGPDVLFGLEGNPSRVFEVSTVDGGPITTRFQTDAGTRFAELIAWMHDHLAADLSVTVLADRACLSPRHFARRFRDDYGMTPGAFVERLRLDAARQRLVSGERPIGEIAGAVGFDSADVFRRAFQRRIGVAPHAYRRRFRADDATGAG